MSDETRIKERLRDWIVERTGRIAAADLTFDFPILERRVLRSLNVPELLRFVADLRGRSLAVHDIRPGVFRDIDTIYRSFFAGAAASAAAPGADDLQVYENGQVALSGHLLALYRRLDDVFAGWAARDGASEHLFPPIMPAAELERIGYLGNFAHLATFPVTLSAGEDNIARLADAERDPNDLALPTLSKVRDVLTPAACYHAYVHLRGRRLSETRYLTMKATCFRREGSYVPLERLWSFSMREIVCVGGADDVQRFLDRYREVVSGFASELGLTTRWADATDPFFRPARNAKHLAQQLDPVKQELIWDDRLSLGSVNLHRSHFGEAFGIHHAEQPAWTGCVAFGLERWLAAITAAHGKDPARWPAAALPARSGCSM